MRKLTREQNRAIGSLRGPVRLVAGARAGKTTTVAHRIESLVRSGVSPEKIVANTLSKKAANELNSRLTAL